MVFHWLLDVENSEMGVLFFSLTACGWFGLLFPRILLYLCVVFYFEVLHFNKFRD